jgi:hypothetical protein
VATILIVEDARELNDRLPHVEDEGRRVIHAVDGPSALTTAQLEHPDLVIRHQLGPTHKGDLATRIPCRGPQTVRSGIMPRAAISGWVAQRLTDVIEAAWAETIVYGCWRGEDRRSW